VMSRGVWGGGGGGWGGVCVMRLEIGGGEDARGRFEQNVSYNFAKLSPGLGGEIFGVI